MWKLILQMLQSFQPAASVAVKNAVEAALENKEMQTVVVGAATDAIAGLTHHATASVIVGSVVNDLMPHITTWTAEELSAAETNYLATPPNGISAFAAGVAWAVAHQTTSLTTGIAEAVAKGASAPAVAQGPAGVPGAAVTGAKVAEAVAAGDVAHAAIDTLTAQAAGEKIA
jgi:hypothetical protein